MVTQALLRAGHDVTIYSLVDADGGSADSESRNSAIAGVREIGADIVVVPMPNENPSRREILRKTLWPSSKVFYQTESIAEELQRHLKDANLDGVFVYHFEALAPTRGLTGVARVAGAGDPTHLPIVYRWWFNPKRLTLRSCLSTWLAAMAILRLRRIETSLLSECQFYGAFAAHHARWLSEHGAPGCTYFRVPIPDEAGPQWKTRRSTVKAKKPKILLVGQLRGIATLTGLELFATKILPLLEKKYGPDGFEAHIVGKYPPPPHLSGLLSRPGVKLRGYVERLDLEFLSADVLLVPTPIKLGIRVRILIGFSFGCCVVAHENNALGIPEMIHGHNALLARRGTEFLDAITRVLDDDALRHRLEVNARETYERFFRPEIAAAPIVRELERMAITSAPLMETTI
jgi:glycosyltransferase involved in cell wall biosynthesis